MGDEPQYPPVDASLVDYLYEMVDQRLLDADTDRELWEAKAQRDLVNHLLHIHETWASKQGPPPSSQHSPLLEGQSLPPKTSRISNRRPRFERPTRPKRTQ